MTRLLIPWLVVGALAVPASAQKPGPPASARFTAEACVDRDSLEVSASATWSHARVDTIQFSASVNRSLLGDISADGGGNRDGAVNVSWVPRLSTRDAIADQIEVTFFDSKDRWTLIGIVPIGPC
jgi:hypothetical protein